MEAIEEFDEKKVRLNMWLKSTTYNELKMLSEFEGRTVSDIVRQVIGVYLRDNENSIDKQRSRAKARQERIGS